jgi:hypothetical protein
LQRRDPELARVFGERGIAQLIEELQGALRTLATAGKNGEVQSHGVG